MMNIHRSYSERRGGFVCCKRCGYRGRKDEMIEDVFNERKYYCGHNCLEHDRMKTQWFLEEKRREIHKV